MEWVPAGSVFGGGGLNALKTDLFVKKISQVSRRLFVSKGWSGEVAGWFESFVFSFSFFAAYHSDISVVIIHRSLVENENQKP